MASREGHPLQVHDASPPGPRRAAGPAWLEETPFWALSALLHLLLLVLFFRIVGDLDPIREARVEVPGVVRVVETPPRVRRPPPSIETREPSLDWKPSEVAHVPRPSEEVEARIPRGTDLDRIADFNLERNGVFADIAVGGSPAGAYGLPDRKGHRTMPGVTPESERAVEAALEWLRRHQSADGSWKAADFTRECVEVCRNLDPRYGDGRGFREHDVGVTGLAVLAFTGSGHTHRDSGCADTSACLRRAVDYLLSVQVRSNDPSLDGRFGSGVGEQWIYDHALATLALGETLLLSHDVLRLERPLTAAVRLCLRARNEDFGWRYGLQPGDNDTSVTGWMVLALKTARHARLDVPAEEYDRAFTGALRWLDRATAACGRTGYMAPGDEGSRLQAGHPEPYPFSKEPSCMTGVGVLCRILAGESRKRPAVRSGVRILMAQVPRWQEPNGRSLSTVNFYYWYYASHALFQYGGREWERWSEAMKRSLVPTQRSGGDEDGSWDPIDEWGPAGGRVYSTALGALTLEVFYRYLRATEGLDLGGSTAAATPR